MQSLNPIGVREAQILKISESKKDLAALRQHLKEIVEGPAFRGSHRSAQFLTYIVEQSIAGRFDLLKERLIGVELFRRDPSYDTGEDAIVRVTASDVRKRLLQHYGRNGTSCEFKLNLPSGSYIPEITDDRDGEGGLVGGMEPAHTSEPPLQNLAQERPDAPTVSAEQVSASAPPVVDHGDASPVRKVSVRQWVLLGCLILALGFAFRGVLWDKSSAKAAASSPVLPWSVLFGSPHATHLITSDPNIVVVQEIIGSELSVSNYANHQYIPDPNKLTPEEIRFCHTLLWGDDSAAAVDPPITASIASLAEANSRRIDVRSARGIQLADLKTDDNFIFLGSPRSNPWSALFRNELDFRFVFDDTAKQEIIDNVHPRQGEMAEYVPTALGWATGQSYAIIAFVQNLDQNGQVLLLAGANGEGTEAAGRLIADPVRLSDALHTCGISPRGPLKHFEMLLHLSTMAGSPTSAEVVACHIL